MVRNISKVRNRQELSVATLIKKGNVMSKKYESLAQDIIKNIGGKQNVKDVYHCQTRLRFKLAEEEKADKAALEAMDGVAKVIINAGVYQVVIGTHVADVFEEVEKLVNIKKDTGDEQGEKKGIVNTVIDFVAGTFQPIIPALSGAGMVKAIMALLVVFHLISTESQTYYMLNVFADGVFYFLPMLLAFCEAQKLRCNPVLAAGVAAMLLHPNWLSLVTAAEPVHFFEVLPFTLTSYASSVIPIILIVFVQAYVEKLLKKWIPKAVELVFVPMFTFLIMGTLAFSVLGPIGSILGNYLAIFFEFLSTNVSWLPAVLIGGLLPVMVMFGLHNGVAPLGVMQMANLGYDSIFGPGCLCSNMAQASAGLVVTLRSKDKKERQTAASGSITAYMGITEPILYGINLPKKYPLAAAMIGGGLGGAYAGFTHTHRFATGSSGLPAVLLYIGDNTMTFFINIIIAILISAVVSAVLTYLFSLRFEKGEKASQEETAQEKTTPIKSDDMTFLVPVQGEVHPISDAEDEAFASEALGKGAVIFPSEGAVYAPFNGTVEALFPTKHAIGLRSDSGIEVLIHVGIDTVKLDGKYFEAFTEQGAHVEKGQKLISFEKEAIEKEGYKTQVMVVISNSDDYNEITLTAHGSADVKSQLVEIK